MAGVTAEAVQWENEKKAKHLMLDVDQEKPQTETVMEMLMVLLQSYNLLTALMGTNPPRDNGIAEGATLLQLAQLCCSATMHGQCLILASPLHLWIWF